MSMMAKVTQLWLASSPSAARMLTYWRQKEIVQSPTVEANQCAFAALNTISQLVHFAVSSGHQPTDVISLDVNQLQPTTLDIITTWRWQLRPAASRPVALHRMNPVRLTWPAASLSNHSAGDHSIRSVTANQPGPVTVESITSPRLLLNHFKQLSSAKGEH